jgi:hypothetical protein
MNPDPLTPAPGVETTAPGLLPPVAAGPEFQPLDPRVVKLWRLQNAITFAVMLGLGLVGVVFVGFMTGAWLWGWAAWGALAAALLTLWAWYPPRAYRAWGYRLDGQVLETREGIWFRTLTLLPLSRLQHVDLHSGPLQRSLGLASLLLHTAGTHHATIIIPGLDAHEAARLRDQLVAVGGDDAV